MSAERKEKVRAVVERLAAKYMLENVGFPGILVSVTRVEVSDELGTVKIYFSVFPEQEEERIIKEVLSLKKDLRSAIAEGMPMKFVPNIELLPDELIKKQHKVEELFRKIN
jgi:ribosome-binding factor A